MPGYPGIFCMYSHPSREMILQTIEAMEHQQKYQLAAADYHRQLNATNTITWLKDLLEPIDKIEEEPAA